jgi:uncharacterized membrane protein YfhO
VYRNRAPVSRAKLIAQRSPTAHSTQASGTAEFEEDGLNRVVLKTQAEMESLLVLSDTYYPGWRVAVDGEPADIEPHPPVFRAVELRNGRHTVEWQYDPASFRIGLFISLLAASLLAAVCAESSWRRLVREVKAGRSK